MIDFEKIKVIIWDLDDTLWNGTLSEGDVSLPEDRISFLKTITDCGVINTICSKNDETTANNKLKEFGIRDLFVFPSISWDPKGMRVTSLLKNMALRPENALFIDDNNSNIKEVEYYNRGIMSASPEDLGSIFDFFSVSPKKDIEHNRLAQYQVLESKYIDSLNYSSNTEFLESCNIHIEFIYNVDNYFSRIYELIQRTNQLNYTKIRCSYEDLSNDLSDPSNSFACIKVSDRFGDYGIVGFYLLHNNNLKHFLFSCRTIGLGIEQYVYYKLGCPRISIKPDVAIELNHDVFPHWITEEHIHSEDSKTYDETEKSILFKGPCDMSGMVGYLQMPNVIDKDFTFTDDEGHLIETHNHSSHIYGSYLWSQEVYTQLEKDAFFINDNSVRKCDFKKYKIIFLSTLIEGIYGRYKHKDSGAIVAFGHYNYPLTSPDYWDPYITSSIQNYGYHITKEQLSLFSEKFEYLGRTTPDDYILFLKWLLSVIPQNTVLCLILGSEIPFDDEIDSSYLDRAEYHKAFNKAIRSFINKNDRIKLIEITRFIKSQKDFSNNINHFTPSVYFNMSRHVLSIIKEYDHSFTASTSKTRYFIKQYIQPVLLRILPNSLYSWARGVFVNK